MYKMFIDDLRIPSDVYDGDVSDYIIVRSYKEGVEKIIKDGLPSFISFDHDLGDTSHPEKTGYDFAKYIVNYMMDNNILNEIQFYVHSANPIGKANIEAYISNYNTFIK